MKNLILALASVFTMGASAIPLNMPVETDSTALASSISAKLMSFNLNDGSYLASKKINSGKVVIKYADMTPQIVLALQPAFSCPPNMLCAMVMPPMIVNTFPLDSMQKGVCGEVTYTGVVDQTPVDGVRTEISVVDHSADTCDRVYEYPTEVTLTVTGRNISEVHYMGGDFLK